MAYFHTNVLDPQIKALPTVATAQGSVASFDTDMTEDLIEVVCDIQYSQASGTPSPSNPLPITVYNALNLSHSGADTSNPTVYNIPFGQTVAKGTLNVTMGVLTAEFSGLVALNSLTYVKTTVGGNDCFYANLANGSKKAFPDMQGLCSDYANSNDANMSDDNTCRFYGSDIYNFSRVLIRDDSKASLTAEQFKTAVTGSIIYELETPQTIQLSATQVTALLNENHIWCDTNGDTEVKFLLSVGKAIS